jgi:hypothetical protein
LVEIGLPEFWQDPHGDFLWAIKNQAHYFLDPGAANVRIGEKDLSTRKQASHSQNSGFYRPWLLPMRDNYLALSRIMSQ